MIVLARAPVVRGFEVQQEQGAHRGDGFESAGRLTTGFLDEGHVGFVEAVPGEQERPESSSLLGIDIYTAVLRSS